uniref:Protein TAPETUM DETERMINANT 1-like n=1 Tax=Nelumbo nucifera TaxID=4432 RepID=A0A822XV70_NELNU|nr:TPA_asm: hypothetical protein HUJ06_025106 [Nelumbo nucifera]
MTGSANRGFGFGFGIDPPAALGLGLLLIFFNIVIGAEPRRTSGLVRDVATPTPITTSTNNCTTLPRKLLLMSTANEVPNRIGKNKRCSIADIGVNQGPTAPLPNGIPTYTVHILNVGINECNISNIHISCRWFSTARLINPKVFRRLGYNNCLVNDGGALIPGQILSFQYANSFPYPMKVFSFTCQC